MISNVMCSIRYCITGTGTNHALINQRVSSRKLGLSGSVSKLALVAGLFFAATLALPAQAQSMREGGFVIQPMMLEETVRPGLLSQFELALENQSRTDSQAVTLRVVELTQALDSTWSPQESLTAIMKNPNFDVSKHNSCKDWLTIDPKNVRTKLSPFERKKVGVQVKVPGGKRGFYCAGIIATLQPRVGSSGVRLKYMFVVPILLSIEGGVLFNKVQMADADMNLREKTRNLPEASMLSFDVKNVGETQAILQVHAQLRALSKDRWKNISRFDFPSRRIIPGAYLRFERDYGKSLPTGRYKLSAVAYVNGQRSRGIEKEINYVGKSNAGKLNEAVALEFDPELLQIDCKPRVKRSGKTRIYNNSNEPVKVKLSIELPPHMRNKVVNGLRCDTLSCPDWLSVRPQEGFQLRPFQERSVVVIAQMPAEEQLYANYYADLVVDSFYMDGSKAGQVRSPVCVNNQAVVHEPLFRNLGAELEEFGSSRYVLKTAFFNEGDMHIKPEVRARVMQFQPGETRGVSIRNVPMKTNANLSSLMLPYEQRTFFANLDFTGIPQGDYTLRIDYSFDGLDEPGQINKQVSVRVVAEDTIVENFRDVRTSVGTVTAQTAQWK